MQSLRAFLMRHRALALMLIVAALGMKIVVPTGYMIGAGSKVLTVQICDDTQGNHAAKALIIPMKGGAAGSKQAKADCPFSTLSMGVTTAQPSLCAPWGAPSRGLCGAAAWGERLWPRILFDPDLGPNTF